LFFEKFSCCISCSDLALRLISSPKTIPTRGRNNGKNLAKKIATYPLWMLVWKVCSVNSNELFGNSWQKYRREDGGPTAFHALASRGSGLAKAGHQERYCENTARASLMQLRVVQQAFLSQLT